MSNDDLESRVTTLEHEVGRLREEVTSARALAALADRDVAEFRAEMRAHRQVLNALRETQLEQGQQIDELRREMHEGFARQDREMRAGFARQDREMRAGFAMQATGMAQITALLTTIAGPEHNGR